MKEIINSTKYCDLLKQAKVSNGDSVYAIEKIFVKENKREEVRFVYYKIDAEGKENFVPRPLDLEEEYLVDLLKSGIKSGVIEKGLLERVIKEL